MNKTVYLLFTQFLLLYGEFMLGSAGIALPLAELGALHTVLAFGRNWGMAAALLNGMILSALYGGYWNLLYIVINPLLAWLLSWWIENHDEHISADFWQPGAAAGLASALPAAAGLIFLWGQSGSYPVELHYLLLRAVWCAAVSSGAFVLTVLLGEGLTEFLGLPRFLTRKAGQKR